MSEQLDLIWNCYECHLPMPGGLREGRTPLLETQQYTDGLCAPHAQRNIDLIKERFVKKNRLGGV